MGSCSFHLDGCHSSFHPGRNSIRLPPLAPFHPASTITSGCATFAIPSGCRHFPPGCITSGILLRRHSTLMFHIRNSNAGWERREFQLPRSHISGSSNSAYPESFAYILPVPWCSPEASRYLPPTFWDIFLRCFPKASRYVRPTIEIFWDILL